MPDDIQRTIYKLEIDDSGYIKGVENLSASTAKLTAEQEKANKALKTNEAALKASSEFLQQTKKDLEDYTGTNQKYRAQLEKSFQGAQADQIKLTKLVADNKSAYDAATQSAQNFANTAAKATGLQQQTTGGKIPVAPPPPLNLPGSLSNQIASTINITDFSAHIEAIAQTKSEFDQLRTSITLAEERMKQLNATDEEFKLLAPIVAQGKDALLQYDKATQVTTEHTISFRSQMIAGRQALAALTLAGKENTQEFRTLELHVAELTHLYKVQREELVILSSRTRGLDFGKAAIESAISGFQIYSSVSILAGGASEELQKKTLQLFAAMQLLSSLEQISLQLKKGGVLFTNLQSAAQATYTAVVGASTGALKAFRLALAGTGIGIAIVAIGFLISKLLDAGEEVKKLTKDQEELNKMQEEAAKASGKQVGQLEILRSKINDHDLSLKSRNKSVDDYNKIADKANQIDKSQINDIAEVNKLIDAQTELILKRGLARAAESIITQKGEAFILALEKANVSSIEEANKKLDALNNHTFELQQQITETTTAAQAKAIEKQNQQKALQGLALVGAQLAFAELQNTIKNFKSILNDPDLVVPGIDGKKIENVFVKTLGELIARLRAASRKEFQSIDIIQQEFTDKLFSEIDRIDQLVAKKQLTPSQGNLLVKILEKIIGKEADKTIADFKKKVEDAINKLTDELSNIQNKTNLDSINLLQDEFDKRAKLIDANEKIELANAKQSTKERLDALELDRLLIGEKAYQDAKAIIISTGEQNDLNIIAKFGQDRQDLAADIFKKQLDAFNQGLETGLIGRDEEIAKQIRAASDKFLAGKTTFKQFEKDITKIQKDEEGIRRNTILDNQRSELAALDRHIGTIKDKTSKEYQDLIKQQQELRGKIANNEKEDAIKNAKDANDDPNKRKKDSLNDYVSAVGQLADSVIAFWQKANEAESAALDRSITLQEKRVDAAQRIAARGNATYLKQEEDRLKDLQNKREAAARKQLGIDAALQASQVLVGITGAIAKIATPGTGIAETIGAIAVIIGALATGYGIVKSLQGNQPKLAKGDPYVKRNGHPAGVDTIPAWLNEGEAVTSAEKNKAYHPVIKAIHSGTVPADQLNNFVKTYHRHKQVPQIDYSRVKNAAELHIGQDGKMAIAIAEQNRLIMENTDVQRAVLRQIKNMGVNVSLDQNGFAVTQMQVIDQMKKDKKI